MQMIFKIAAIACVGILSSSCKPKIVVPETLSYQIVSVLPHDPNSYTQGLQMVGGRLLESGGMYQQSSIREVDPKNGSILKKRNLPGDIFAEGMTLHANEIWLLTWKEKTAYVLNAENFSTIRTYHYDGEGWGLTSDGKELIMSNGSSTLNFRSFKDMSVTKSLEVTEEGRPVKLLNELEYIKGDIFANIYTTDRVARIDSKTGQVTGWIDFSALRRQLPTPNRAEALNGIAFNEKTGHLLITGKWWPQMFEIKMTGPQSLKNAD